jgi:hypothetical protein
VGRAVARTSGANLGAKWDGRRAARDRCTSGHCLECSVEVRSPHPRGGRRACGGAVGTRGLGVVSTARSTVGCQVLVVLAAGSRACRPRCGTLLVKQAPLRNRRRGREGESSCPRRRPAASSAEAGAIVGGSEEGADWGGGGGGDGKGEGSRLHGRHGRGGVEARRDGGDPMGAMAAQRMRGCGGRADDAGLGEAEADARGGGGEAEANSR